jgi:hypothetical protein
MYDFAHKADCKTWVTETTKLIESYGLIFTKFSDVGESASKGNRILTFKGGMKRLEEHNYQGFDVITMTANPPYTELFNDVYLASAGCDFDEDRRAIAYFSLDIDIAGGFNREAIDEIFLKYYEMFKPRYSFCGLIEWWRNAFWYSRGMTWIMNQYRSKWKIEELHEIKQWQHEYNVFHYGTYKTGDFRDIYEINYIGPEHLSMDIGDGRKLRDMIGKEPGWGTLKQSVENMYSWHLTTEEAQVLRQNLAPTGRILALKKPGS